MNLSSAAVDLRFRIAPLDPAFVERVRCTRRDDFDRPVAITLAQGGEPLRDQLRRAEPGERLLLCSYEAVPRPSAYAEIGPIYISADCPAGAPFFDVLPPDYFVSRFALRSYNEQHAIIDASLVERDEATAQLRTLLARPEVAYVHARFGAYGCFAARIDRVEAMEPA